MAIIAMNEAQVEEPVPGALGECSGQSYARRSGSWRQHAERIHLHVQENLGNNSGAMLPLTARKLANWFLKGIYWCDPLIDGGPGWT